MNPSFNSNNNLAQQVHLYQNILEPTQRNTTFELSTSNNSKLNKHYASRVRLTQKKLALAKQNSSLHIKAHNIILLPQIPIFCFPLHYN